MEPGIKNGNNKAPLKAFKLFLKFLEIKQVKMKKQSIRHQEVCINW